METRVNLLPVTRKDKMLNFRGFAFRAFRCRYRVSIVTRFGKSNYKNKIYKRRIKQD